MSNRLDKLIALGLVLAVVFTALAHGAVEAWSVAIFEFLILILLWLWAMKAAVDKRLVVAIPAAARPLLALLALGVAQSVALTDGAGRRLSLSLDSEATRAAVTTIFFLVVSFFIGVNYFTTRQRLVALVNFLTVYGLALAVFAIVQRLTWDGRIYWLRALKAATGYGGPFVNRNHFAGYLEMLIPLALALALARGIRGELRLLYGFAAAMMGVAVIGSLSRGGIISLLASVSLLAALSVPRQPRAAGRAARPSRAVEARRRATRFAAAPLVLALLVIAAITAGAFWIGADTGISYRLTNDAVTDAAPMSRIGLWQDTLALIRAHPLWGVGLGAYETVYPGYGRGDGALVVAQAHNDYLQALADGGVVLGALAVWFIVALGRAVKSGIAQRDARLRAIARGSGAGIFAMLVHSIFDFNLQIPANALLFLLLAAVAARGGSAARAAASSQAVQINEASLATQ